MVLKLAEQGKEGEGEEAEKVMIAEKGMDEN